MARTLEELLQQEKPEVVDAAKDKAEKILRELEAVDQDTPQDVSIHQDGVDGISSAGMG
ncbi:hypothetical protein ACB283_20775 [Aeromonas caviae]